MILTAVPFTLWFKAIGQVGAVAVAPFFLLVPITAFILDAPIKGFVPTAFQLAGTVIVIAGLVLSQLTPKARLPHASQKAPRVHHTKPS